MKKIISAALACTLLFSAAAVGAAEKDKKVRVVVKNDKFSTADGAAWDGVLIDERVELSDGDSVESVLENTIKAKGYALEVSDYGYISAVNGLAEMSNNGSGGWMAALNDWFTSDSTAAYTVENGGLEPDDEIVMMFTNDWGADCGSLYGVLDTSLKGLSVEGGSLSGEFSPGTKEYSVTVTGKNAEILVTPEAYNKNYQVRVYKNEYQPGVNGAELKKSRPITVSDGDRIYIGVGNPEWPTMNSWVGTAEETVYELNISYSAADEAFFKKYNETASTLQNLDFQVGSLGGEWAVLGLARGGMLGEDKKEAYVRNVGEYVRSVGSGKLNKNKATDNDRVILALSSVGKNAEDVEDYNLVAPLTEFDYVSKQGLNGVVWSLLALDSFNYPVEANANGENTATRERLIESILEAQCADGGWTFFGDSSDPDMTAMAVQALAPYRFYDDEINAAVGRAVERMKAFRSLASSESYAQIVTALCTLGIDPEEDEDFRGNGASPVDKLMSFSVEGGFSHALGGEYNQMATEQAFYAMTAYLRLKNGQTALFDMTDIADYSVCDFDGDGYETIKDATHIQRFLAEFDAALSTPQKRTADLNKNGSVDIGDVTLLQKRLAQFD